MTGTTLDPAMSGPTLIVDLIRAAEMYRNLAMPDTERGFRERAWEIACERHGHPEAIH